MNLYFSINDKRWVTDRVEHLNQRQRMRPKIYDVSYLWCRSHLKTLKYMVKLLYAQNKRPTVLDIGCGNKPLQALFPHAGYLGVDIDKNSAADMFLDCNQDNLPLDDNSVDAVIMSNSLEHIHNTQHIIQEVRRVLRPNGFFYFSVPMSYPVHAHPHDYTRFTNYYFQQTFADWELIEINATNSIFSTPILLYGLIFTGIFPRWIAFFPILLNNITALAIDHVTKFIFKLINIRVLERAWGSCPIDLDGIYKKIL